MQQARQSARTCAAMIGLIFVTAASAQTSPPTHPPVEAFGTLPAMMRPSISPDGKHVATIQPYSGKPIARIFTLDPLGVPAVNLPIGDGYIEDVMWANNDRLLIRININQDLFRQGVDAWYRLVSTDVTGKTFAMMFSDRPKSRDVNNDASIVLDLAEEDPDHIYMPLYNDFSGREHPSESMSDYLNSVWRVDVASGRSSVVVKGNTDTKSWVMDGHGSVVARVDQTTNPRVDHLKVRQSNGDWNEIDATPVTADTGMGTSGLTGDGKALVHPYFDDKTGIVGLMTRNLNGSGTDNLFLDPKYDIDTALTDPWTGRVIGVRIISEAAKDIYFDPAMKTLQAALEQAFPGLGPHAVTWDMSKQKVIVAVESPRQPPVFFLLNRQTHEAAPIRKLYPGLSDNVLGEMRPFTYKAGDGLEIPAYLTLPPGKEAKNLPLVVYPHGGPMARDRLTFDPFAQFLATRGYAVFQPNFRGSSGYGRKFLEAGYGQWGLKMQDDITDGVKKLIADGVADPKRICIVGESYGGYAALEGAASTPDLYACAAGWAGVYDLRRFLATRAKDYGRDSQMIESWQAFIGNRWNDSDKLDSASPAFNADKIKAPVLLMHGADDTTVRIDQSETMERALRHAGKRVAFIAIPKETHDMKMADTRIRWLTELEKFLKANIGD
jgi:dipeptidyl aminopeptidase/acylaminoacyl peptidase